MGTRRTVFGLTIVAAWLVMVGWQARRAYFQPELARLAEAALTLNPGVSFYTLEMGDRAVGQATSRLDTVPEGFLLEDFMALELQALGQTGTAVARTRVQLDPSLLMRSFSFSMESALGGFQAEGEVVGDTTLRVAIRSEGAADQEVEYRLASPPVFSAVVPIRVAVGGDLEVGRRVRMPVFDPTSLSTRDVEVEVLEAGTLVVTDSASLDRATGRWAPATYDTIPVWRIAESFGGVSVESWIDEDGRVVEASSALGFSMRKTEYELARQAMEDSRKSTGRAVDDDVILATAIQSDADLGEVTQHDELRFVLSGVDLAGFDLDGGRQTLRGDTLIVRREDWRSLDPGYSLPYKRMDLGEYLRPEPLVQSDDPRIVAMAEDFTSRRTQWSPDPLDATRQLTRSVYAQMEKAITFSIPNAVQVAEALRGDCNEHTVLFVALARAVGLPARTAVGLVYLDGAFYYHAWPEVWLGEWVAVDPTFGQYPADAAHIRFVIGGLAQQVEIVRLIGRLDIEVVPESLADGD